MGALSFSMAQGLWTQPRWQFANGVAAAGFVFWAGAALVVQSYRAICSHRRQDEEPFHANYWNLQIDVQGKFIMAWVAVPVVSWLLSLVFGPG
jgi:hypothetical protein